jgi:4-alpha-glucanotransferase
MVVTATLDDALAVEERPNMPGTAGDGWPNWSLALPKSLEELERSNLALAIARALQR